MNLTIATNTKEALLAAEQAITKLFKLQDGVIEALEQVADVLQKMAAKTEAQYGEVHPHLKNLRAAIALVDKSIDKEIDAGIARHDAKAAQPETKPAPQGSAPEGIAPPADQVPAPGAAAAEATAEQSSVVAPQDEAPQPEAEPAAPAPIQPSYDDAKAAVINLGKTLGREAITELLAGFNAKRLPEVPQDQLAYVIAAANKRLEQHFFEENEQALAEDLGEAGW